MFALGTMLGAGVAALWMRARIAQLETEKRMLAEAEVSQEAKLRSLADAAFRANQDSILQAARATLETVRAEMSGDLTNRQSAIHGMVQPLNDSLGRLEKQVRDMEMARQHAFGSLGEQIQALAKETVTLSTALRSPQARGRWGEITLRRVAELSGMVKNCDFLEQHSVRTETGRIRPDMIVRLPGGRSIVVDAKVPLTAYVDAVSASDDGARQASLRRHAQQVCEHVKQLSGKQYWSQFQPAPELVILFLPGEHFFSAALECYPDLLEDAVGKKVVIATPVTLIAVLKGIAYGWTEAQLAENAEKIRSVAADLYDRVLAVYDRYAQTGRQLEKTVECYNDSVGSWDARLLPALRRVHELGVGSDDVPEPEPLRAVTRMPRAV